MIRFRKDILVRLQVLWGYAASAIRPQRLAAAGLHLLQTVSGIRRLRNWHRNRTLRKRPGHFRLPKPPGLIRRLPWHWLRNPRPVSVGVLTTAVLIAVVMMSDAQTVGEDAGQIVRSIERSRPEPPPMPEGKGVHLRGKVALLLQVAMLQEALDRLENIGTYTATFEKQERIKDTLSDNQVMQLKIRHEPFSVYFKVEEGDAGREILYPISSSDDRMLVQLPKLGGNLPALKLEPSSSLAMSESRYPISMAGIKELTKMALEIRRTDVNRGSGLQIDMRDDRTFNRRPVFAFSMQYDSANVSKTYRKCELYIDKQLMLPVYVRNWTWGSAAEESSDDEETLIEYYAFSDVNLEAGLNSADFSRDNGTYRFK